MEIYQVIIFLGGLILCSHIFSALFNRTRVPNVLLLLIIGIIVGPLTNLITVDYFGQFGRVFTTITLIVILFESGTNLKFAEIRSSIGSASIITVINFMLTVIITSLILRFLTDLNDLSCLFVGAIIGGTSSAVVIPMIKQLTIGKRSSTILLLESALSDVLCLIVGLALLDGMRENVLNLGAMLDQMWKALLFAAIIGVLFGFAWSVILHFIRDVKNTMFTSFAAAFILYGVVEMFSLNGGISILAFGILVGNFTSLTNTRLFRRLSVLSNSELNLAQKGFFAEIVFIVQTYFFVYVGLSIQFGKTSTYLIALVIVALIFITRQLSIRILPKKDINLKDIVIMSIMTPKGLIPAVLASIPLLLGLEYGEIIQDLGYAIVFLSILLCSILVIILSNDPLLFIRMTRGRKDPDPDEE